MPDNQETPVLPELVDAPAPTVRTTPIRQQPIENPLDVPPPYTAYTYTRSATIGKLAEALAKAQAEFPEIERTIEATIKIREEKGGGSYKYEYADLATILNAVRPVLARHGLALLQPPTSRKGFVLATTLLVHSSGEWIQNDLPIGCDSTDPKAIGSAATFGRRYSVSGLLSLAAGYEEDDDGDKANKANEAARRRADQQASRPQVMMPSDVFRAATQRGWSTATLNDFVQRIKGKSPTQLQKGEECAAVIRAIQTAPEES